MSQAFAYKRAPGKRQGVTYVWLLASLLLLMFAAAFFIEGIAFFSDHPTTTMNDAEFFGAFAMLASATAAFLLLAHRNFKIGIHWGFAIAFALLFACNAVGVFLLPFHVEGTSTAAQITFDYSYTFSVMERVRYLICFAVCCFYFYLFFAFFPKMFHSGRFVQFFCYIALISAFAAIVYSLIKEWNLYVPLFDPSKDWKVNEVMSFTNNPNSFGFMVLMGMIAVFLLHNRRSHWYWIALLFFLGLFQLVIGSGSACLASWILIGAFVVYRFCVTLKYHTGAALWWMFVFVASAIAITIFVFAGTFGPNSVFTRIGVQLRAAQFSNTSGQLRIETWNIISNHLDTPLKRIFGIGDFQSYYYLGLLQEPVGPSGVPCIYYAHSGFMQQYISGGFIRLGFYVALIARFVYLCVKGMGRKSRLAWPLLLSMSALLVRSAFESTSFLQLDTKGLYVYLILVLPIEVEEFLAKHPETKGYEEQAKADAGIFRFHFDYTPLRFAKAAFLFSTPAFAMALGAIPQFFRLGIWTEASSWVYYVLLLEAYLLAPFGFYCVGHHVSRAARKFFGALFGAAVYGCMTVGLFLYPVSPIVSYVMVGAIPAIVLLAFLFHARSVIHFREKLMLHAYLPHVLICGILIGLASLGYLVPIEQGSLFLPIMEMLGIVSLYCCVLYTRYGEELGYPFLQKARSRDCRWTALGILREERLYVRQTYYLKAGHVKGTGKGKTYIHRY